MPFIVIALFILAFLVVVPLIFIWAVNTLFAVGVSYTVTNWFAALILVFIFTGNGSKAR